MEIFAEADVGDGNASILDLLGKGHAVRCSVLRFSTEWRNNWLAPDSRRAPNERTGPTLPSKAPGFPSVLEAHGLGVAHRKARRIQEIHVQVQKGFDWVRERIHGITLIAVQRLPTRSHVAWAVRYSKVLAASCNLQTTFAPSDATEMRIGRVASRPR